VTINSPSAASQNNTAVQIQALVLPSGSSLSQPAALHAESSSVSSSASATAVALPAQSVSQSTGTTAYSPGADTPAVPEWRFDDAVPEQPTAPIQDKATPEEVAPSEPVPMSEPPATAPPVVPIEPKGEDPMDQIDLALAEVSLSMAARRLDMISPPAEDQESTIQNQLVPSLSALAGTALLAAGGYRLVIGRSDRIRRRWSPIRFM
jgi:hypothetical protein